MNYGELRTRFKAILNRRDCTDALANSFIAMSIQKAQRTLRIPAFERTYTETPSTTAADSIDIPSDFIALRYIRTDTRTLDRLDVGDFVRYSQNSEISDEPRFFTREGSAWKIWPALAVDASLYVVYYAEDAELVEATDQSTLSVVAPDVIIYGALVYAADYFADDRMTPWAQVYDRVLTEVQQQAADEESSGSSMTVQPMYPDAEF